VFPRIEELTGSHRSPYFGQAAWFKLFHSEKIPSAIDRYVKEIHRVLGVLDGVLSKQEYLVGDKLTIADLSFVTWNNGVPRLLGEDFDFDKEYPNTARWVSSSPVFFSEFSMLYVDHCLGFS
jgi:glutathione S-transferase